MNNKYKLIGMSDIDRISQGRIVITDTILNYIYLNSKGNLFKGITTIYERDYIVVDAEDITNRKKHNKLIQEIYQMVILYILENNAIERFYFDLLNDTIYMYFLDNVGDISYIRLDYDFINHMNAEDKEILNEIIINKTFTRSLLHNYKRLTDFIQPQALLDPSTAENIKYFNTFEDLKEYVISQRKHVNSFEEVAQLAIKIYDLKIGIKTYYIEDIGIYIYTEI